MSASTLVAVGALVCLTVGAVNWGDMQWFHLLLRSGLAAAGSVLALVASHKAILTFVEASSSGLGPEDETPESSTGRDVTRTSAPDEDTPMESRESTRNSGDTADDTDLDAQQIADVISQQMND